MCCRFNAFGDLLFASDMNNAVFCRNILAGRTEALRGSESWVHCLATDGAGGSVVGGSFAGKLFWWSQTDPTGEPFRVVNAHRGFVRGVSISPDMKYVASGGDDKAVRIWSFADGAPVKELTGHESRIYNVMFHPNGQSLLSGDLTGHLKEWEVGTWKHVRDLDAGLLHTYDKFVRLHLGGSYGMDFTPDGRRLVVSGITDVTNAANAEGKPAALLFDWETGKRLAVMTQEAATNGVLWGVCFDPAGELIVAANGDLSGQLSFWKTGDEKPFFNYPLPSACFDVAFHPDGLRIAVALFGGEVRIYDLSPPLDAPEKPKSVAANPRAAG
jgi:hypothetical protein